MESDAVLMQDLGKISLAPMSSEEEKQRFLNTVAVEKLRIQRKMLKGTYDSAFDLYRSGRYEAAQEVAERILTIDPGFKDAQILREASGQLKGPGAGRASERALLDERFKEGLAFFEEGRLIEAERRFEEVTKLAPGHLKARYWLRRVKGELADAHFGKGKDAYQSGQLQEALDHWYAAILLNPHYPKLVGAIEKAEAEKRHKDAEEALARALELHEQGKLEEAVDALQKVLQVDPGSAKALALLEETRDAMAKGLADQGRKLYGQRKFKEAIASWEKAEKAGFDAGRVKTWISQARKLMREEREAKKAQAEKAKKRVEEEAKVKEEEEAKGEDEYAFSSDFMGGTGAKAAKKDKEEAKKVDGKAVVSAAGSTEVSPEAERRATEAKRREALQRYQAGMVFLQNRQIEKAKYELEQAKNLDPTNMEIEAALRRIDAIISGQ